MTRHFQIAGGPALRGEERPSRLMRDTLRTIDIPISTRHAPFAQMMVDLAAVVSIVVLACMTGVGLAAAGFILFCVKLQVFDHVGR